MQGHRSLQQQVAILSPSLGEDPMGQSTRSMLSVFSLLHWNRLLITGQDQGEHLSRMDPQPQLQVLESFSNWSWKEIPGVTKMLWDYRPDWVHIVTPKSGLSHPLVWLPALTHPLWPHRVSCSLSSETSLSGFAWKTLQPLVLQANLIWVPSERLRARLSAQLGPERLKQTPVFIHRGLTGGNSQSPETLPEELKQILSEPGTNIFIPGTVSDQPDPLQFLQRLQRIQVELGENCRFIFAGGWGPLGLRTKTRIQKTLQQEQWTAHWLAPIGLSSVQQDLLKSCCPLFLDPEKRLPRPFSQGPEDREINQWLRVLHQGPGSIR